MKENKNLPWARDWKGSCEAQGPGWKGHQCVLRLGGTQPIWSCNTNMMGSVWPQIAQGSGILMPRHTLLHTRMLLRPFCILMTRPHECNRANKVAIFGQSVCLMHARERICICGLIAGEGLLPLQRTLHFRSKGQWRPWREIWLSEEL